MIGLQAVSKLPFAAMIDDAWGDAEGPTLQHQLCATVIYIHIAIISTWAFATSFPFDEVVSVLRRVLPYTLLYCCTLLLYTIAVHYC